MILFIYVFPDQIPEQDEENQRIDEGMIQQNCQIKQKHCFLAWHWKKNTKVYIF